MIILDTMVVSALMDDPIDPKVKDMVDGLPDLELYLTTITVMEIRFGIEIRSAGRRRRALEKAFQESVIEDFLGRVLPFDVEAGIAAGSILASRKVKGRPVEVRDTMIGAIAVVNSATLATRNIRHFRDLGIDLIDPWS